MSGPGSLDVWVAMSAVLRMYVCDDDAMQDLSEGGQVLTMFEESLAALDVFLAKFEDPDLELSVRGLARNAPVNALMQMVDRVGGVSIAAPTRFPQARHHAPFHGRAHATASLALFLDPCIACGVVCNARFRAYSKVHGEFRFCD